MRFRSAGLAAFVSALMCVAFFGCKKESTVTAPPPPTTPATEPPEAVEPPPPPPYKVPDKLPVRATVAFFKKDDGAAIYKVTFGQSFTFDPTKAKLALDVNTVSWTYHGRIVITNKNDEEAAGSQSHEELYDQPPTTDQLDLPEERVLLNPTENQWVKEGGVTLFIRNPEGADASAAPPKVLTVDLVEQGSGE